MRKVDSVRSVGGDIWAGCVYTRLRGKVGNEEETGDVGSGGSIVGGEGANARPDRICKRQTRLPEKYRQ